MMLPKRAESRNKVSQIGWDERTRVWVGNLRVLVLKKEIEKRLR